MALKRDSAAAKREAAQRLLQDPDFQAIIGDEERTLAINIANHDHDGSDEAQRLQDQWCADLRAINRIKRRMFSPGSQLNQLNEGIE